MKRLLFALLAVGLFAVPASAQVYIAPANAIGVSDAVSAVSTDVAIYVKYIGTSAATSTVAVDAATGDISFVDGALAGPDTTINPLSAGVGLCGNTAGTIDVNDVDCNTIGTVIDQINGSPNWIAWPGSALRSDSADNTLITLAATPAQNGLALLRDTAVALAVTLDLRPGVHTSGAFFIQRNGGNPSTYAMDPFFGYQTVVWNIGENVTCAGGAIGNVIVYGVTQKANTKRTKTAGAVAAAVSYTESVRTIWQQAGAACGSELLITRPLMAQPGERVLVRVNSTVTLTVPLVFANGVFYLNDKP